METVPCNACGSDQAEVILIGRDRVYNHPERFQLVRCSQCHLVYLNPRPDPQEIGTYYPKQYQQALRDTYTGERKGVSRVGLKVGLRRRTPPLVPGGRLLDIGCGGGHYLQCMKELGWAVQGIEFDEAQAAHAREQLSADVRAGTAESTLDGLPSEHFDVVTLWHVLEHLHNPTLVLREVHRVLKPGGRIMVEVPNFQSIDRVLFKSYWYPLELPRHLYHFGPRTLRALLGQCGFEVDSIRGTPAAIPVTASLQLLWNHWRNKSTGLAIALNPLLLIPAFIATAILGRFRLSGIMLATGRKSGG